MIGFLRFLGVANAAVWFGCAIFFTFGVAPAVFSEEMRRGILGEQLYPDYSGRIAMLILERYFLFHLVCGIIALLHLVAEFLYMGKPLQRLTLYLLLGIFALGLLGGYWLQPKLQNLHRERYARTSTPEQVQRAARSFSSWHGWSQVLNLVVMVGVAVYLWRVTTPSSGYRYRT